MAGEYHGFGISSDQVHTPAGERAISRARSTPQEQARDLAKRFSKKTNQRAHAFVGQLVIRVRGRGRFDNHRQAVH